MSLWRVFQLEESQFRVKEVSKASGVGASAGGGWAANLICQEPNTDFCHNVLCQLGKYASSGRGGPAVRGPARGPDPSRASVNTYGLMSGPPVIIFQVAG